MSNSSGQGHADRSPADLAAEAASTIAELSGVEQHDIALTLGSGWGRAAEQIGEVVAQIPADQVARVRSLAVVEHSSLLTTIRLADARHA